MHLQTLSPMWGRLLLFSKSFSLHTRFRFIYTQRTVLILARSFFMRLLELCAGGVVVAGFVFGDAGCHG